jgi:SAM-dependent methyltransferase
MGVSGLHPTARAFESAAAEYERGRPGYPQGAVEYLAGRLGISAGKTVVDLAAGTGKLTRGLQPAGAFLIAIEPLETMLAELVRAVPEVAPVTAVAEGLPLAGGSVDAVVVANAWHWFDPPAVLGELRRVLRPRGHLAIVYNRRDESVEWVARLSEIIDEYRGDTPHYRSGRWREEFKTTPLFGPLDRRDFQWEQPLSAALLRDRVASVSFIARLDGKRCTQVMRAVDELAAHEFGGRKEFAMPHTTEVYVTQVVE